MRCSPTCCSPSRRRARSWRRRRSASSQLRIDGQGKLLPPELMFAAKTGTAQVKRITEREREMGVTQDSLPWHLRHHALFVCWGPLDNPRYACAVIVEHGQAGGAT